tara:strand:+ start:1544 stop:2323 length:780 start_codon:yes stop_codon:yes gene_type:complete
MAQIKGLFTLLEMLPFLGNITFPKPREPCVNTRKYKKRKDKNNTPEKFAEERSCEHCYKTFVAIKKAQLFCDNECKQQYQYDLHKNPFSITDLTENNYHEQSGTYGEYYVPPEILAQAELYSECALEENHGYSCSIHEDVDDLHQILRSEYSLSKARYEKRAKAKYSGKRYWEAKMLKNHRRKQLGLTRLSSVRYHNFDLKIQQHHQVRRGEIPKQTMPTEAEIENPGFATITPMKTKSGKSIAEILDNVQRKKFMGSN